MLAGGGDERSNYFFAFNHTYYTGWMPKEHITNLSDLSFKLNFALTPERKFTVAGAYLHGEKQGFRARGPNPPAAWEHHWPNLRRPGVSITYTQKVSANSTITFRTTPVQIGYDLNYRRWKTGDPPEGVPMTMRRRYSLWRNEFAQDVWVSPESVLSWGLWHQRDIDEKTKPNPAPALGPWVKYDMNWYGAYVQNTFRAGRLGALATLGLRYDDVNPGESALVPFVSYHTQLDVDTSIRVAVTRNRRFPLLDELYGWGINIGNPNLKPHTAWTYQADVERSLQGGVSKLTGSLFYADHTDMIAVDPSYVYQNIGKARTRGLELSYESELTSGEGSWWLNYSFLDAKDLIKDRPLVPAYRTAPPKHAFKAGATFQSKEGFVFTPEVYFFGPRATDVDTPTYVGAPWNVTIPTEVPGYTIVNLKVSKAIGNGLSAFLSVENLLDKDYEEIVFYKRAARWVTLGLSQKF